MLWEIDFPKAKHRSFVLFIGLDITFIIGENIVTAQQQPQPQQQNNHNCSWFETK